MAEQAQTSQTTQQRRPRSHRSFGVRVDTVYLLRDVKQRFGYRTYSHVISDLVNTYANIDLAKVEIATRQQATGHVYITVSKDAYEQLLKLKQQYGYTFDILLHKLLTLKTKAENATEKTETNQ